MDFESFVLAAATADLHEEPAARDHADAVEFRMDMAEEPLTALEEYDGKLPIIATNRVEWEGGNAPDEEARTDALCTAVEHDAVEAISFTGSTDVGKYLANNSGMTELTLELGGNDPTIVWDDTDVEAVASRVVGGACSNAGQVCNSVERVLVHETVEDDLVDAMVDAAESLTVGDPFDEETDVAAMVDDDQFETVVDLFEATVDQGATVECGGDYGDDLGERVFEPTVLSDVTPDMPAASEETFGPLVPVIPVSDFDEAIEEANNTNYGLEAGLFTQDMDRAKRAADEIDAGGVNVNTVSGFRADHMPYGGFKDSGVGKEGIKYALDHFSREKLVGFHQGFNA